MKSLWNVVDDLAIAWKGQASAGFQQLISRWDTDVRKLLGAMDNIAGMLDTSGTRHQVNDEEQQQVLDRIHATLNPRG